MLISSVKALFNFINLTSFFLGFLIQELFQLSFFSSKGINLILNFGQKSLKKTGLLSVLRILGGSSKDC
mgnify:CR=1 FL=1